MGTTPTTLSQAEIDEYSIRHHIELVLTADGWMPPVEVFDVSDGWPVYENLYVPGVYVLVQEGEAVHVPYELGSHAKRREVFIQIFAKNDAQRVRLAEKISDMFRDIIPIYDYVTGNETTPSVAAEFETDSVGWRKLTQTRNTPTKERWRSVVTASLRRVAT